MKQNILGIGLVTLVLAVSLIARADDYEKRGIPLVIKCTATGTHKLGTNVVEFQPGDCEGGRLPDERYVGAMSTVQVIGGHLNFRLFQPDDSERKNAVQFYANAANTYTITAIFIRQIRL